MKKSVTRIGVVFGGVSREHSVSIKSAKTVVNALRGKSNKSKFEVIAIYLDKKGRWLTGSIAEDILSTCKEIEGESLSKNEKSKGFYQLAKVIDNIDIWYPVIHGPNGEDGSLQGLFQLTGKPFVGSGVLGSAVGMDKITMKIIFAAAGLPQAPYLAFNAEEIELEEKNLSIINEIEQTLGYPCFIKPANLGSSIGITKAYSKKEIIEGLHLAATLDKRIVVEKNINGRELECAILGKTNMKASTVGEISICGDWYDYQTKYSNDLSQVIIPAPISKEIFLKVQELSLLACKAISAEGIARVDFFFDDEENQLFINEINTLPGFTEKSMYPKLWAESGMNLEQLVANLVATAKE